MRRLSAMALTLVVACATSTALLAQTPGDTPDTPPPVSKGEQLAALQFKLLDANHDGQLSRDEVVMFSRRRTPLIRPTATTTGLLTSRKSACLPRPTAHNATRPRGLLRLRSKADRRSSNCRK